VYDAMARTFYRNPQLSNHRVYAICRTFHRKCRLSNSSRMYAIRLDRTARGEGNTAPTPNLLHAYRIAPQPCGGQSSHDVGLVACSCPTVFGRIVSGRLAGDNFGHECPVGIDAVGAIAELFGPQIRTPERSKSGDAFMAPVVRYCLTCIHRISFRRCSDVTILHHLRNNANREAPLAYHAKCRTFHRVLHLSSHIAYTRNLNLFHGKSRLSSHIAYTR